MGRIHYEIEIEIFEGPGCDHHREGQKYRFPEDVRKICPWFMDSIGSMVRVLQFGGTLPWKYTGTRYEKDLEEEGTTTEFVRCPDPTEAGIVAKITRRALKEPKEVGLS